MNEVENSKNITYFLIVKKTNMPEEEKKEGAPAAGAPEEGKKAEGAEEEAKPAE